MMRSHRSWRSAARHNQTRIDVSGCFFCVALSFVFFFFFFQAEDGIRFHCVTGVQTCALPIWGVSVCRAGRIITKAIIQITYAEKFLPELPELMRGELPTTRSDPRKSRG